jgi:hypothetical protein
VHNHLSNVYNVALRVAHIDALPLFIMSACFVKMSTFNLNSACGSISMSNIFALLSVLKKACNMTQNLIEIKFDHLTRLELRSLRKLSCVSGFLLLFNFIW